MKYVIRKVPQRNTAYLERLLPGALIVNDIHHKGAIESFHEAIRQADDDAVYVQDDMILCKNFMEKTKRYILRYPDSVIVFSNYVHEKTPMKTEGFFLSDNLPWLLCTYIPRDIAKQYLSEVESGAWKISNIDKKHQYDDLNWGKWLKHWWKNVFLTVPNLAGHPANRSVIDRRRPPRTCLNFDYENAEPRLEGEEQE